MSARIEFKYNYLSMNMTKSQETSVIADDATITGNVEFIGTLIVEGKLEGDLTGTDVTVQKTGQITGTLNIEALNCHGEIEGNIKAKHIVAHSTAVLTGEIQATTFEMASGARINGQINMASATSGAVKNTPFKPNKKTQSIPNKKNKSSKLSDLVLD